MTHIMKLLLTPHPRLERSKSDKEDEGVESAEKHQTPVHFYKWPSVTSFTSLKASLTEGAGHHESMKKITPFSSVHLESGEM